MTFEEWQKTKVWTEKMSDVYTGEEPHGYVYDDESFIIKEGDGWYIFIYSDEYNYGKDELEEAEGRLWNDHAMYNYGDE